MDTRHPLQTEVISHILPCTYLESKCALGSSAYLKGKKGMKEERIHLHAAWRPWLGTEAPVREPGALELVLAIATMSCSTQGCLSVSNCFLLPSWHEGGLGGCLTLSYKPAAPWPQPSQQR